MNEVLSAIRDRFSCRSFTDQMPPQEELQLIAQAGVQAPSAMNLQRWRVIMVKNKALMDEIEQEGLAQLDLGDKTAAERIRSRGRGLFYGAPCMAMLPMEAGSGLDCGILCENIAIAAKSFGIESLICGLAGLAFAGDKGPSIKKRLGFPEGYEFGIAVLLGYVKDKTAPHEPDYSKISFIE